MNRRAFFSALAGVPIATVAAAKENDDGEVVVRADKIVPASGSTVRIGGDDELVICSLHRGQNEGKGE